MNLYGVGTGKDGLFGFLENSLRSAFRPPTRNGTPEVKSQSESRPPLEIRTTSDALLVSISARARDLAGQPTQDPPGVVRPRVLEKNGPAGPTPSRNGALQGLQPGGSVSGMFSGDQFGGQFYVDGLGMIGTFDRDGNIQIGDFEGTVGANNTATVTNKETGETLQFSYSTEGDTFSIFDITSVSSGLS